MTPLDKPLHIKHTAGSGDGDNFESHDSSETLVVSLREILGAKFDRLELYDGDLPLGTFSGTPATVTLTDHQPDLVTLIVACATGSWSLFRAPPHDCGRVTGQSGTLAVTIGLQQYRKIA